MSVVGPNEYKKRRGRTKSDHFMREGKVGRSDATPNKLKLFP